MSIYNVHKEWKFKMSICLFASLFAFTKWSSPLIINVWCQLQVLGLVLKISVIWIGLPKHRIVAIHSTAFEHWKAPHNTKKKFWNSMFFIFIPMFWLVKLPNISAILGFRSSDTCLRLALIYLWSSVLIFKYHSLYKTSFMTKEKKINCLK